jgi:LPS export ABC transporter protein LptC
MIRRAACVLVGLVALALSACQESQQAPVAHGATAADSADQVLYVAHFLLTNRGIKRGDLTADTAYVLDDQTRFDLRVAHVVFTTETGASQGTMEANKGMYSTRTQVLEGWGNVIVKMTDGRTLHSPHVVFNQILHTITSDTTFTITRGSDTAHGIGFSTTPSGHPFNCLRNCGGTTSLLLPDR